MRFSPKEELRLLRSYLRQAEDLRARIFNAQEIGRKDVVRGHVRKLIAVVSKVSDLLELGNKALKRRLKHRNPRRTRSKRAEKHRPRSALDAYKDFREEAERLGIL